MSADKTKSTVAPDEVSYVDATFDGEKRRLELRRHRIRAFEHALAISVEGIDAVGFSAYAALRRMWEGAWSVRDVEETLAFALETETEHDEHSKQLHDLQANIVRAMTGRRISLPPRYAPYNPRAVIERDGHAAYVALAERILRAALFGIKPEEADFDNWVEPEVGDDEAA